MRLESPSVWSLGAFIFVVIMGIPYLAGAIAIWRGTPGPFGIADRAERRYREMFTTAGVDSMLSAALPLGIGVELITGALAIEMAAEVLAPSWSMPPPVNVALTVSIVLGFLCGAIAGTTYAFAFPQFLIPPRFRRAYSAEGER